MRHVPHPRTLASLMLALLFPLALQAQSEVLTNQSVIDMLGFGFDEEIILSKIESSACEFDTSIGELKRLKEAEVPGKVIAAMIRATKAAEEETSARENDVSGIFYTDLEGKLRKIYPTSFSGTKNNVLGAALTYGIAKATIKATMPGSTSVNALGTATPLFHFFFRKEGATPSLSDWWFSAATSPNQFVLVKLEVKRNSRRLETGRANLFTGNSSVGIDEESTQNLFIRTINDYEFEVRPTEVLEPGEYCFLYKGIVPGGGYSNQAVFDFSIPEGAKRPDGCLKQGDATYALTEKGKVQEYTVERVLMEEDGGIVYECTALNVRKPRRIRAEECRESATELRKEKKEKRNKEK